MFFSILPEMNLLAPTTCPEFAGERIGRLRPGDAFAGSRENSGMGAPVFTEAELRRALKVAAEFSAAVEVHPRQGVIRILAPGTALEPPRRDKDADENPCDAAFGL